MNEIWVDIPETDGKLQVSNQGAVRSQLRGEWRVLKTQADNKGYLRLSYTYKRGRRREKIHRLVAFMFVPSDPGRPHVNHINGNKTDNRAANLEWCTNKENARHAIGAGLWDTFLEGAQESNRQRMRPVYAINIKSGSINHFESVCDAQQSCRTKHVCAVIHGERNKANGYVFSYAERGEVMP